MERERPWLVLLLPTYLTFYPFSAWHLLCWVLRTQRLGDFWYKLVRSAQRPRNTRQVQTPGFSMRASCGITQGDLDDLHKPRPMRYLSAASFISLYINGAREKWTITGTSSLEYRQPPWLKDTFQLFLDIHEILIQWLNVWAMVHEQPAGPQVSFFHDIDDAEPMGLTSGLAPLCASGPPEADSLSGGNWPERGPSWALMAVMVINIFASDHHFS